MDGGNHNLGTVGRLDPRVPKRQTESGPVASPVEELGVPAHHLPFPVALHPSLDAKPRIGRRENRPCRLRLVWGFRGFSGAKRQKRTHKHCVDCNEKLPDFDLDSESSGHCETWDMTRTNFGRWWSHIVRRPFARRSAPPGLGLPLFWFGRTGGGGWMLGGGQSPHLRTWERRPSDTLLKEQLSGQRAQRGAHRRPATFFVAAEASVFLRLR